MHSKDKIDLDDCHNDDTIWGLAVKTSFELIDNHVWQKDHILHRLIQIGITGGEGAYTQQVYCGFIVGSETIHPPQTQWVSDGFF